MNSAELLRDVQGADFASCSLVPSAEVFDLAASATEAVAAQVFETLRLRSGQSVAIRLLEPEDREALQRYFMMLSPGARRNRFIGASNGPSERELDLLFRPGRQNRFAVIAVLMVNGVRTIAGEAICMFDQATGGVEFGLSVHDDCQRGGIGSALLSSLERLAAALGADHICGDTLRTNNGMQALARKAGFSFANTPGDWCERHMVKPCTTAPMAPGLPGEWSSSTKSALDLSPELRGRSGSQ